MAIDYFSKTGGSKDEMAASLQRHLEWLYPLTEPQCKCDHGWRSEGRLHGVNMGYGWQRTSTHPHCPHHGTAAVAEWKRKRKEGKRR